MRLLLDAHVSPAVAHWLVVDGIDVVSLRDWQDGNYRHAPDDQILTAAVAEGRVLVTFDRRSMQPLLKEWAEAGQHHAGVVVIDRKTIRQNDIGGLIRAVRALVKAEGERDWQDRLAFLRAAIGEVLPAGRPARPRSCGTARWLWSTNPSAAATANTTGVVLTYFSGFHTH